MARQYNSYKFYYTNDLTENILRTQREYKDNLGSVIIPVTNLFLSRRYQGKEKVSKNVDKERHVLVTIVDESNDAGKAEYKQFLPFNPSDNNLVLHLKEIKSVVSNKFPEYCLDYYGEGRA